MEIKQTILDKNSCYVEALPLEVKGLLLHSVGCPVSEAMRFVSTWNPPKNRIVCVHAFIDSNDGVVYQTLPWDMRGRHSGGSANATHIGVEMCESETLKYITNFTFECSDIEKAREQVTRVYNVAVELFAYLCDNAENGEMLAEAEKCIDILKILPDILSEYYTEFSMPTEYMARFDVYKDYIKMLLSERGCAQTERSTGSTK